MTKKFENKVVIVTGGTSGIGLATAKAFSQEGASVFITGRRKEALDAAVKDIGRVTGVQADMSKLVDIDRLYDAVQQKHAQIDILFANAGGGEMALLGAITEEHYEKTFATNVKGTLFTVQKALPLLRDGASIILTSSTTSISGTPAFSVYSATKAPSATLRATGSSTSRTAISASTRSALALPIRQASMSCSAMATKRRIRRTTLRASSLPVVSASRKRSPRLSSSSHPTMPPSSTASNCSSMAARLRSDTMT